VPLAASFNEMPRPIPRDAPVTSAVRPLSSDIFSSSVLCGMDGRDGRSDIVRAASCDLRTPPTYHLKSSDRRETRCSSRLHCEFAATHMHTPHEAQRVAATDRWPRALSQLCRMAGWSRQGRTSPLASSAISAAVTAIDLTARARPTSTDSGGCWRTRPPSTEPNTWKN